MYKEYPKFLNDEVLEYDRKSRTDDPLLSVEEILEKHEKIIKEYAEKHLGGPIPEKNKYREVGSGESIKDRPEINKVLKAIESPAIKAIAVVDVQRLSRGDLEDAGRLIKILRYTNTYVITPYKTYDLRDEYDRDAFERELKRGNEYLEYFKKIQARGKLASVKEGNFVGSTPPYGFNRVEIADDKRTCFTLEEKKEEADVVRLIFNWYCNEDIGTTAICRRLESMSIKTASGNTKWEPNTINSMLENVHYIGCVRWNWQKTINIIEDQEVRKTRPKAKKVSEYLVFEGKHDGIISKELFEKAKEIKGKRHRTNTDKTLKNPFSGIVFCRCGAAVGYNTYRKKGVEYAPPKLVCNNQVHCKSGSVLFSEVKEYICEVLQDCIDDFEVRIKNNQDDSVKLHSNLIANLEKKIKELEATEIEQWEAQYDPDPDKRMPPHIFKKLNERLLLEKEEVNKALCKAYESMPKPVNYRDKATSFREALDALNNPNIPASETNRYLKRIIKRIEYKRDPFVRITKENIHLYPVLNINQNPYYAPPFELNIELRD